MLVKKSKMKGAEPIFIDKKSKIGILMLHGFTSTPFQFREVAEYLARKKYTVLAPLIAGHGTCPADLEKTTTEDWKKSVKDAYSKLRKTAEKIVIVGNSFGGNLGFYLARQFPDSTLGMVSLGTPIRLRFQRIIKTRYYLYGWMKRYYHKPRRIYKIDYTDMTDEVTYSLIPIKSLLEFFKFIKEETIPNLKNVKTPTLVMHASVDQVVNPSSANYIYENLGSSLKRIYWIDTREHIITDKERRLEVIEKALQFIEEIKKNNKAND